MPNIPDAPLTREEQYLAAIANGGGTVPEVPLTRVEQYLNAILQGGGGGGSQEPLVLQGVFDTNPFAGSVTGATKEEIFAAWNAGKLIKFELSGYSILFTLGLDMDTSSDTSKLVAYFLWQTGGTFFASGIVNLSTMTYRVFLYQGLTLAQG